MAETSRLVELTVSEKVNCSVPLFTSRLYPVSIGGSMSILNTEDG